MSKLRISLAQINPTVGDFEQNANKIVKTIEEAKKAKADIITFPELAVCGYPPEDLLLKNKFLQDNRLTLENITKYTEGISAIVGFADMFDHKVYNASAIISNKRLVDVYHKVELPNYGVFDEKRYFTPGDRCITFEIKGIKASMNIGIGFMTIPITPIFTSYLQSLKETFDDDKHGIEMENLQARIRGNILMTMSNKFGWLVLTTGNKSETAVGYCTLYGDMAGGFAVIKDVPKMLVYELANFVNKKTQREIIPASVIKRPPTAELKPNQKDEDSLPPYSILDPILKAYVEEDKSLNEIVRCGFNIETVKEVLRMVDRNEYKRRQSPPGIKITPKAFGKDRRLPITNHYRERNYN